MAERLQVFGRELAETELPNNLLTASNLLNAQTSRKDSFKVCKKLFLKHSICATSHIHFLANKTILCFTVFFLGRDSRSSKPRTQTLGEHQRTGPQRSGQQSKPWSTREPCYSAQVNLWVFHSLNPLFPLEFFFFLQCTFILWWSAERLQIIVRFYYICRVVSQSRGGVASSHIFTLTVYPVVDW